MSGLLQTPDRYRINKLRKIKGQEIFPFFSTASPLLSNYYKMTLVKKTCDVLSDYHNIYLYFTMFYMILVIILPLIIISLFNTLLILRLYKSNDQWTTTKLEMHEQELSYKEIRDKKVQIENLKITWTLIIISLSFIVLTLPYGVIYFVDKFYGRSNAKKAQTFLSFQFSKIVELFYMLNHSINFFLYVLSRNSFRRVLKEKLKCDCFNVKNYSYPVSINNIELRLRWLNEGVSTNTEENTKNNTKSNKSSKELERSAHSNSSPRPAAGVESI